jgi:translation elongation factor P/translation initiation factor 5A
MRYKVMFYNEDGSFYFMDYETLEGLDLSDKRVFERSNDGNYLEIFI